MYIGLKIVMVTIWIMKSWYCNQLHSWPNLDSDASKSFGVYVFFLQVELVYGVNHEGRSNDVYHFILSDCNYFEVLNLLVAILWKID